MYVNEFAVNLLRPWIRYDREQRKIRMAHRLMVAFLLVLLIFCACGFFCRSLNIK